MIDIRDCAPLGTWQCDMPRRPPRLHAVARHLWRAVHYRGLFRIGRRRQHFPGDTADDRVRSRFDPADVEEFVGVLGERRSELLEDL
jgi:hypothetical protein